MARLVGPQAQMYPTDDGCWYCGRPLEETDSGWEITRDGAWHAQCQTAARLWEWSVSQHRMSCHLPNCDRDPKYPFDREATT